MSSEDTHSPGRRVLRPLVAVTILLAFAGCVEFGWNRLSTEVPSAVLDTIRPDTLESELQALRRVAGRATTDEQGRATSAPASVERLRALAQHLSRRMAELGLVSAGQGGFLRPFPMNAIRIDEARLRLGERELQPGEELALFSHRGERSTRVYGELVFVGHGILAPERDRDDYLGLDLRGKVALILAGPPDSSYVDTWYADARYQWREAVRHGALGVILVHPGSESSEEAGVPAVLPDWETTRSRYSRYQYALRADSLRHADFVAWVSREVGDRVLRSVDIDPRLARAAARNPAFRGRALGVPVTLEIRASVTPTLGYDLIAQALGKYAEDQSLLVGASLDGSEESLRACAGLLQLARAFTQLAEPTARSVIFVVFGDGEWGGREQLGAEAYALSPVRELALSSGGLVLDGELDAGTAGGIDDNELGRLLTTMAQEEDIELREAENHARWFAGAAPALAAQGLPTITVACDVEDLRATMRAGFHLAQTEGNPRWDQYSAFRFFPRR